MSILRKNCAVIICLFIVVSCSNNQTEGKAYNASFSSFIDQYNTKNYAGLFESFSPEMQDFLPLEETVKFFESIMLSAGKINSWELISKNNLSYSYKCEFDKGIYIISISLDAESQITGLEIRPYEKNDVKTPERNITPCTLPFHNEWTVIWGGDSKEDNYHQENPAQKNAFDFVITGSDGKSFKNGGKTNEDYYAYGREIMSPCDGEVVMAVDGIKDNEPGKVNPYYVLGNSVIMKTENKEYLIFAHLKQYSVNIKSGDKIKTGEVIGLCGNSGNSTEPHLHFHMQDREDITEAIGIKCYFNDLQVNGVEKRDYSPVRGEKVSNK